jgi:hypothetical protein
LLGTVLFAHFGDKSIAPRTHRLNVFRCFGIVAQRLSEFGDFAGQRVLSYVSAIPHDLENFIFLDQPAAILNQEEEQSKCFRLELNRVARFKGANIARSTLRSSNKNAEEFSRVIEPSSNHQLHPGTKTHLVVSIRMVPKRESL